MSRKIGGSLPLGLLLGMGLGVSATHARDNLARNVSERYWRYRDSMESASILAQNPAFQAGGQPYSGVEMKFRKPLTLRQVQQWVGAHLGSRWRILAVDGTSEKVMGVRVSSPGMRPVLRSELDSLNVANLLVGAPVLVDLPVLLQTPGTGAISVKSAVRKKGKHRRKPVIPKAPLEDENEIRGEGNCISVLLQNLSRPRPPGSIDLEDLLKLPLTGSVRCPELQACPYSPRRRLWAQEQVGASMARKRLAELGVPLQGVKVAVVDDGFDIPGNGQRMDPPVTEVRGQNSMIQPADQAKHGVGEHGTVVAGFISGRGGVGVAPGVSVQPYVYAGVASSDSFTIFQAGTPLDVALKACQDGYPIINLSVGSVSDESGRNEWEAREGEKLKKLEDSGCLVVKAAGNSGYRNRGAKDSHGDSVTIDDALLRVGATQPVGGPSSFSTVGEVNAPGTGVFGLRSSQNSSNTKAADLKLGRVLVNPACDAPPRDDQGAPRESSEGFTDGTSFASPITAGVSAMAYAVLKQSTAFTQASAPDRVRLLARLVRDSQNEEGVHALRAVEFAHLWVQEAQKSGFSAATQALQSGDLNRRLQADPRCVDAGPSPSCLPPRVTKDPASCTAVVDCREGLETLNAVCGPNQSREQALFELSLESDDLEGALRKLRQIVRLEKAQPPNRASPETQAKARQLLALFQKRGAFLRTDLLGLDRMTAMLSVIQEIHPEGAVGAEKRALEDDLDALLARDILERTLGGPDGLGVIPSNFTSRTFENQVEAYAALLARYRSLVGEDLMLRKLADWSSRESLARANESVVTGPWILSRLLVLQSLGKAGSGATQGFREKMRQAYTRVVGDIESLEIPIGSLSAIGAAMSLNAVGVASNLQSATDFEIMARLWKMGRQEWVGNPEADAKGVIAASDAWLSGGISGANRSLAGVLIHSRLIEQAHALSSLNGETRMKVEVEIQRMKDYLKTSHDPAALEAVFLRGRDGLLSKSEQLEVATQWVERLGSESPAVLGDLLVEHFSGSVDALNFIFDEYSVLGVGTTLLTNDEQRRLHQAVHAGYRNVLRSYRQAMEMDTKSEAGQATRNIRQTGDLMVHELLTHALVEDWGMGPLTDPNNWILEARALKASVQAHPDRYSHLVKNGIRALEKRLGAPL